MRYKSPLYFTPGGNKPLFSSNDLYEAKLDMLMGLKPFSVTVSKYDLRILERLMPLIILGTSLSSVLVTYAVPKSPDSGKRLCKSIIVSRKSGSHSSSASRKAINSQFA